MTDEMSFPSPGRCIFCGSAEGPRTREHILPKAIGGDRVIQDATCEPCQTATGRVEIRTHRAHLLGPRKFLGLEGHKSGRERRKQMPLRCETARGEETIMVDVDDHPAMLMFPKYSVAGWFQGIAEKPAAPKMVSAVERMFNVDYAMLKRKYGILRPVVAQVMFDDLDQYLAKIAHCIAVAKFGINGFVPVLPKRILAADDGSRPLLPFIGGSPNKHLPPGEGLHVATGFENERDGLRFFYVDIQLFAAFNMPTYSVLVGFPLLSRVPAWAS